MTAKKIEFSITLNGVQTEPKTLPAHWRLLDYLHEIEGLTGTKYGCGGGMCKACTVAFVDSNSIHHAIPACSTSLDTCNGWQIETIEGLGDETKPNVFQTEFANADAFQCGYCTPGFILESHCLLENRRRGYGVVVEPMVATSAALDSHLCRCSGYQRYVNVLAEVLKKETPSTQGTHQPNKWKLIRYLHEAAEVENALMLQYLYAAFSIKRPMYSALAGKGHRTPGHPHSLLAIAIEEMLHLDTVNRLLVELGAEPNLVRQDYPFEPKIYPFKFDFEPLSRKSLAKYILAEAPKDFDIDNPDLYKELMEIAETRQPVNDIGSFYEAIRKELRQYGNATNWADLEYWDQQLEHIQTEGEFDHFGFFLNVYNSEHFAFDGFKDVWNDPNSDVYPAVQIKHQTMWAGHDNSIPEGDSRELAKLVDFHYWVTMAIFELSYRNNCEYHAIARRQMAGPLLQLCWHIQENYGVMPPFDRSSIDYKAGLNNDDQIDYVLSVLFKIKQKEQRYAHILPQGYTYSTDETILSFLTIKQNEQEQTE